MNPVEDLKEQIRESILSESEGRGALTDEEVIGIIDRSIQRLSDKSFLSLKEKMILRKEIFHSIRKYDILQELLDRDDVTEIMVNGTESIFYETGGRIIRWNKTFENQEKIFNVIQRMAGNKDRPVNAANPVLDVVLDDGSRVNAALRPVALNGPVITIRRFGKRNIKLSELTDMGALSRDAAEFLKKIVASGYNIFISGSTGSGKTTFLNALSEFIPRDERVITIEDPAELRMEDRPNLVRLETKGRDSEGAKNITIRDLIRTSLRMRPDRIIVGEVRGAETVDMLQAMNTGHKGSMSTGHANSSGDMVVRLETMMLMGMDIPLKAVREQIASAIDIIIHLGRLRDKSRRVLSIDEVLCADDRGVKLNNLFFFREEGDLNDKEVKGRLRKSGNKLNNREKLREAGIAMEDI